MKKTLSFLMAFMIASTLFNMNVSIFLIYSVLSGMPCTENYDFLRAKAEIARKNPAFGRTRPSLREDLVQYDSSFSEEKQESM